MPHYLFQAKYTTQGLQGVLKEGAASRMRVVQTLAESAGGSLVAGYWAFGDHDFMAIAELPDNAAAAAVATTVSATGTSSVTTTVLLTAEDIDEARGRSVTFRPPGA